MLATGRELQHGEGVVAKETRPRAAPQCSPAAARPKPCSNSQPTSSEEPPNDDDDVSSSDDQAASSQGDVKVLVAIANDSDAAEVFAFADVLSQLGAKVVLASVMPNELQCRLLGGLKLRANMCMTQAASLKYRWHAVALPGGLLGARRMRECDALVSLLERHVAWGGKVGAMGAAVSAVLKSLQLLHPMGPTLWLQERSKLHTRIVVEEGRIVTSCGLATALPCALQLGELLFHRDKVEDVAKSLLVPMPEILTLHDIAKQEADSDDDDSSGEKQNALGHKTSARSNKRKRRIRKKKCFTDQEIFMHVVWTRLKLFGWSRPEIGRKRNLYLPPTTSSSSRRSQLMQPLEGRQAVLDFLVDDEQWSERDVTWQMLDLYNACRAVQNELKHGPRLAPGEPDYGGSLENLEQETKRRRPAFASY